MSVTTVVYAETSFFFALTVFLFASKMSCFVICQDVLNKGYLLRTVDAIIERYHKLQFCALL